MNACPRYGEKRSINELFDLKRCPYCVSDLIKKEPHGSEAWMLLASGRNYWIVTVYHFCSAMVPGRFFYI